MRLVELAFFVSAPSILLALVIAGLRREIRDNWRSILFLALACVLFFHRILFLPETVSQSDANLLQLQFFSIYREAVSAGEIPFWNPYQGTGLPNLAQPLSAMFYPLAPVFLVGGIFKSLSVFIVAHYFLAGVFALLLGRMLFRTPQAALVFAVLYAFNGWAMTRAAHQPAIEYLFAYTWLPLVALHFERAVGGRSLLPATAGAGAGLAWMGISCPNFFIHAALLLGLAGAARIAFLAARGRRNALALGVFLIFSALSFAIALGAVEVVPAFELSLVSTSGRLGEVFPAGWRGAALSLRDMLRLYLPYAPDRPFGVYYSPGILAIAAACFALYKALRAKIHRPLAAGALFVLLVGASIVTKAPLYRLITHIVPLFSRASLMPASLLFLFLPVIVLAAAGIEAVIESRRRLIGALGWAAGALVFFELFAVFGIVYPRWGTRRLTYNYATEVADFPHLDEIAGRGESGRLVVSGPPGQVLAPPYAALPRGLSRLNLQPSAFAPDWLTGVLEDTCERLPPDALEVLGVGWVVSTEPIGAYRGVLEVPWPGVAGHFENSIFYPIGNLDEWKRWDRTVRLYRVATAPALARMETTRESAAQFAGSVLADFDSWPPAGDTTATPGTLAVNPGQESPTRVFFAVTAYPGWRLTIDGTPTEWDMAAGAFIAAEVPEGASQLELTFRPTRWGLSLAASCGAFIFALAAGVLEVARTTPCSPPDR